MTFESSKNVMLMYRPVYSVLFFSLRAVWSTGLQRIVRHALTAVFGHCLVFRLHTLHAKLESRKASEQSTEPRQCLTTHRRREVTTLKLVHFPSHVDRIQFVPTHI